MSSLRTSCINTFDRSNSGAGGHPAQSSMLLSPSTIAHFRRCEFLCLYEVDDVLDGHGTDESKQVSADLGETVDSGRKAQTVPSMTKLYL